MDALHLSKPVDPFVTGKDLNYLRMKTWSVGVFSEIRIFISHCIACYLY